jgi:TATA-box binding protein (TBP) (component of TFIID and TFIIIB)
MPGRKRRHAKDQVVHAVDGAPVPISGQPGPGQRSQPTRPQIDLDGKDFGPPSAHFAMSDIVWPNNYVGTAHLQPTVPNMIAMANLGGGEHSVGRNLKLALGHAHIIAHARSGVLNLAGSRSYEAMRIAVSEYIILAAQTGTVIESESIGVHNHQVTFSVGPQLDLGSLAAEHSGCVYRPHIINLLTMYFKNPQCAINAFPTGSVVLLGLERLADIGEAAKKIARVLAPFVVAPTLPSTVARHNAKPAVKRIRPSIEALRRDISFCLPRRRHHEAEEEEGDG